MERLRTHGLGAILPHRRKPEVIEALRDVPHYSGPADGLSHPDHPRLVNGALKAVVPLLYRVNLQVEDPEALAAPSEGGQVVAYDHPSLADPIITMSTLHRLGIDDARSMAKAELFAGPMGAPLTWGGAFPVNRHHPGTVPTQHSVDVVQQGGTVSIAPAGGTARKTEDPVGPFRTGAASIAVKGGAGRIIPITYFYHPHEGAPTEGSRRAGVLGAAAGVTATAAAVVAGGAALPVVGVAGGILAGAWLGGKIAQKFVPHGGTGAAFIRLGARVVGGLLGAAATTAAVVALLPAAPVVGAVAGLAGAAACVGLAREWGTRDVAEVVVGRPLDVPAAVAAAHGSEEEAVRQLTTDLHTQIGETKARLSGTTFDPSWPAIATSRRH